MTSFWRLLHSNAQKEVFVSERIRKQSDTRYAQMLLQ